MIAANGFGAEVVFHFFGQPISTTVTVTWFIMACIMIFVTWGTRKIEDKPNGVQNLLEIFVEAIQGLVKQTMGEHRLNFAPYIGTILVFIASSNLIGLIGIRPPTADLNTTVALALMTFFSCHIFGVKNKGLGGFYSGFLQPIPLLLPLNIIGELATPISLSFRLFGNISGGMIIMSLLYGALGYFALVPIPAILHIYFDVFAGLLQSFIFSMLTMVFVSNAID